MTKEQQNVVAAVGQAIAQRNIVAGMPLTEVILWQRDAIDQADELLSGASDAAGYATANAGDVARVSGASSSLDATANHAGAGALTDAGKQVAQAMALLADQGDAIAKLVALLPGTPPPTYSDVLPDGTGQFTLSAGGRLYYMILVGHGTPSGPDVDKAIGSLGFDPASVTTLWPADFPAKAPIDWPPEPIYKLDPPEFLIRAWGTTLATFPNGAHSVTFPAQTTGGPSGFIRFARVWDMTPGSAGHVEPKPAAASCPVVLPSGQVPAAPTLRLAAKALVLAYQRRHPGGSVPTAGLTMALAWTGVEGAWSDYYRGSNNFGSMHATSRFERTYGQIPGYGMIAFLDHAPKPFIVRMCVFPTLAKGADAYLDLVERDVNLLAVQSAHDYAVQLYTSNYFGGFHTPVTPTRDRPAAAKAGSWTPADLANIADGEKGISAHLAGAQSAIAAIGSEPGDIDARSCGGFAPLGARLTPGPKLVDYSGQTVDGAPHTVDHARAILGPNADKAPFAGAITIADCLAAPGHDGVWMFGTGAPLPGPSPQVAAGAPASKGPIIAAVVVAVLGLGGGLAAASMGGASHGG